MGMRKILILHNSLLGCSVLTAFAQHAQHLANTKVEVVAEYPKPEPILYITPKHVYDLPDITLKSVCYPIGMGNKSNTKGGQKKHRTEQRFAANRHNFKK